MERASSLPKYLYVSLGTTACSLLTAGCGMHTAWTSPTLIKLQAEDSPIPITNDEGSWIATSLFFGSIIGAIIWNFISLRYTKRSILLAACAIFIVSWLIIAFTSSYHLLLVARLLAGISDSIVVCSVSLFLGEVSGSGRRGLVITVSTLSISIGAFFINILGSYASIQTTALVSLTIPLLSLCFFVSIPDSPYDLIQMNMMSEAEVSLKKYRGVDVVEEDFNRINEAIQEVATSTSSYLDLLVLRSYRKSLLTILGVRSIYQLSGFTTIKLYSQLIFFDIGGNNAFAFTLSSIHFSMTIVFTFVSLWLIDTVGRKPLMLSSTVAIVLSLLTLTIFYYLKDAYMISQHVFVYVSSASLLIYVSTFSLGLSFAPSVLMGEIFPPSLKSFASTVHQIYFCILIIFTTKLFQLTGDEYGLQVPFLIFTICTFFGIFFIAYRVPETKNKTLEEIQSLLKNEDQR
ncbi:hypothetical protein FQR65_LT01321 [Abscondita terminalis]|nr:hypothetical protein FQR65_LT01321 [Abscondita terminalis]